MQRNKFNRRSLSTGLRPALFWNYTSLLVFGACGIGITFILAYYYGANVLGYFNFINAIYAVLTQLATIGIHNSVLMYVSRDEHAGQEKAEIITSGVLLSIFLSLPVALLLYFSSNVVAHLFNKEQLGIGLRFLSPAIFLFSINKILLWSLNGLRKIRTYAFAQSLRYICMFAFILFLAIGGVRFEYLILNFVFAEALLFIFIIATLCLILSGGKRPTANWIKRHFSYGMKGFASGLFINLNLNIDIIILGLFVTQSELGVYSFASTIVIGLYQILTAVRISFNPVLAKYIGANETQAVSALIKKSYYLVGIFMFLICVAILAMLPFIIEWFLPSKGFMTSWHLLFIMLAGVFTYSFFFPFDQILAMGAFPAQQTLYNSGVLFLNIILNFLLVPFFGIFGAAFATAIASGIMAPLQLHYLVKKHLNINMFNPIVIFDDRAESNVTIL